MKKLLQFTCLSAVLLITACSNSTYKGQQSSVDQPYGAEYPYGYGYGYGSRSDIRTPIHDSR